MSNQTNVVSIFQLLQEAEGRVAKIRGEHGFHHGSQWELMVLIERLATALRESREENARLADSYDELVTVRLREEALKAERDALRAALQPFAEMVGFHDHRASTDFDAFKGYGAFLAAPSPYTTPSFLVADVLRAREVLARVGTP